MTERTKKGFSLLELLAAVTILGIIASVLIVRITDNVSDAKVKTCFHNRSLINSALERYSLMEGTFATSLDDLDTPDYLPGGVPTCPATSNAYTIDGVTSRISGHTSTTNPGDH